MIMMCRCRFINCNKCIHSGVGGVHSGGGYVCVGRGGIREISVSSSQVFCEPKTAPKTNSIYEYYCSHIFTEKL